MKWLRYMGQFSKGKEKQPEKGKRKKERVKNQH